MATAPNDPKDSGTPSSIATTGNASNPSPEEAKFEAATTDQLLNEKAEKYLRESANIEDMPDAQDEEEADKNLHEESGQ